jgi:hypothetical protein
MKYILSLTLTDKDIEKDKMATIKDKNGNEIPMATLQGESYEELNILFNALCKFVSKPNN